MRVLNLYAGIGGNRTHWENCEVTAVELNPRIANVYRELHPNDSVIETDAHEYLRLNYTEFDFIWTSPPCPTHSTMAKATRHPVKQFPDMKLYEEILFLQNYFKGGFVVENVIPYYQPLIEPTTKAGRHLIWSNFPIGRVDCHRFNGDLINTSTLKGVEQLKRWLGVEFDGVVYFTGSHDPCKFLRNCVHPDVGKQIMEYFQGIEHETQSTLFERQA